MSSPGFKKRLYRWVRDVRTYNWVTQLLYWLNWKLGDKSPKTIFLIFGMGRSGSTLLVDLLNQHPDIHCDGEVLKKKVFHLPSFIDGRRHFYGRKRLYGFRAKLYQATREQKMTFEAFEEQLSGFDVKWIYLYRKDTWKQALSAQVTKQTSIPNAENFEQLLEKPIEIDWAGLEQEWQNREKIKSAERQLIGGRALVELCYEEHLMEVGVRDLAMNELFKKLGLSERSVESKLQRLSNAYPKLIKNYDKLQKNIAAHPSSAQ